MTGLEGMAIGAGSAVVNQGLGMLFGKSQDKRQLKQQGKLQELAIKGNKEMLDYNQQKQLEMWKSTNYQPTVEEMKKAGINPALLYGGGGGGGTTTGSGGGGMGVASAADAASTQQANTASAGMGMQLAAQTQLLQAQKENIEADTENKKAEAGKTTETTKGIEIDNLIKNATQADAIKQIQENASKALAEAVQAQQKQVITEETMQDQIRSIQEEAIGKALKNEGVTTENKQKLAELTVKQFEARMAENGISTNTPWYVKLLTELANKFNLNPLK